MATAALIVLFLHFFHALLVLENARAGRRRHEFALTKFGDRVRSRQAVVPLSVPGSAFVWRSLPVEKPEVAMSRPEPDNLGKLLFDPNLPADVGV